MKVRTVSSDRSSTHVTGLDHVIAEARVEEGVVFGRQGRSAAAPIDPRTLWTPAPPHVQGHVGVLWTEVSRQADVRT